MRPHGQAMRISHIRPQIHISQYFLYASCPFQFIICDLINRDCAWYMDWVSVWCMLIIAFSSDCPQRAVYAKDSTIDQIPSHGVSSVSHDTSSCDWDHLDLPMPPPLFDSQSFLAIFKCTCSLYLYRYQKSNEKIKLSQCLLFWSRFVDRSSNKISLASRTYLDRFHR